MLLRAFLAAAAVAAAAVGAFLATTPGAAFLATPAVFLVAPAFFAVAPAGAFLAAAPDFFAAGAFLAAGAAFLPRAGRGAASRRATNSSAARSSVTPSTVSPLRSEALVDPVGHVRAEPTLLHRHRLPVTGSGPNSRSEAPARPAPRPALGWAKMARASSSVTVNNWPSLCSDRESEPFFR